MPHRRSPPFISPPLLIILIPIITLTLLFLTLPPLLSAATRLLRQASVKNSWDSLNILLVVFAILCGVFARRNDDEQSQNNNQNDAVPDRNAAFREVPPEGQWYGFSEERKVYDNDAPLTHFQSPATGVIRLKRNSSSYPDLRQWETGDDRYKFRFYDDFEIDKQFRQPARDQFPAVDHRKQWPESPQPQEEEEVQVKEIPVDTFEIRPSPPPSKSPTPPPPPPPPPPAASARRNPRRTNQKVERTNEITTEIDDREITSIRSPPPAPPTPPPPSAKSRSEQKHRRSKSNVKREIEKVWASVLSNQRKKKKKQRTKNNHNHNYDDIDEVTNNTTPPQSTPPPPPPPPPPPSSVFQSLFRKGLGKSKKIHSVAAPPPPPPPPKRWLKRSGQIPPPPSPVPEPPRLRNSWRPPLPNRTVTFRDETMTINAGNQSPLIPIPPPPPPFKMAAMKFTVRGDYVKIRSNQSSRCNSPEREVIEVSATAASDAVSNAVTNNNGEVGGSVFCPSPDVNVKAATFIARLRGEWRLEKLNSLKEKGNGLLL